ncbi:MAG: acetyl-CoA acetyltransferase [Anaerolineae bacterium UTCFX2]|nr:thiolase family protein [Anaerolineae bacterium]MCZ7551403.1 thiolase family protein [Anaerolineales bacterium]OQY94981.1 MAG: acetyl-CoA acetyltransferase [Anaerolineae bacterium UTCFX2]
MSEAYIISAVRTPVALGKPQGGLNPIAPVDLTALVMAEAVRRGGARPAWVEDVVWGCVTPIGDQGANLARLAALKAGFPVETPAVTLNRMCGSAQQAVHFAAQAVLTGDMHLVLAGGTEMMSHQPLGADYPAAWPRDFPYELVHQGVSAELMAQKWALDRPALDDFAYQSHLRAMNAIQTGRFESQILPVRRPDGREVRCDEGVRMPPDRAKMAALKPAFKPDGVITAGNSSQISDGAAALLVASPEAVGRYNLAPRARVLARIVVGSDPVLMLDGPIPATRKALKAAGLELEQMDVIEINEAFASVVLAWAKELGVDDFTRVNPNGGAIALGHPLGATGAVLMTKLLYELERTDGRFGLQVMCIGHGMATATILERL